MPNRFSNSAMLLHCRFCRVPWQQHTASLCKLEAKHPCQPHSIMQYAARHASSSG